MHHDTAHTTHAILTPPQLAQTAACLIHIYPTGSLLGRRYQLENQTITLGRGEECQIRIADASVSRSHARIVPTDGGYLVSDCGSTNGTFINDEHVTQATRLRDGDSLRIGKCLYRYLAGNNLEAAYHEEIYRMTILDGLTQLHNRRSLDEFLDLELARSQRHKRPVALVLFDIDKFKSLNDGFGHLCGDCILRELAARLRPEVRKGDWLARYGGEEFALVLVETAPEQGLEVAERLRLLVSSTPFEYERCQHNVTISLGIATTDGSEAITPPILIELADSALYRAKRDGRNRSVLATAASASAALAHAGGGTIP